jgi:hypothetical protein
MRDVQKRPHVFGRSGLLMYGLSAVGEHRGKAADAPASRLLGGGRCNLACDASLIHHSDPALIRTNVRRELYAGFRSLKLHGLFGRHERKEASTSS